MADQIVDPQSQYLAKFRATQQVMTPAMLMMVRRGKCCNSGQALCPNFVREAGQAPRCLQAQGDLSALWADRAFVCPLNQF